MSGSLADFLAMGGYAAYVWSAYGVTAAVMASLLLWCLGDYRRRQRELERLQRDRP